MNALLDVRGLDVSYGHARALSAVSLTVARNSLTAVVGSNGAGKTSLVRAIAGMIRPAGGTIRFGDTDITGLDSHATCELGIGQVAEGRQIFPPSRSMRISRSGERCAALAPGAPRTSRASSTCFRDCPSAGARRPARFQAASSRCWRSAAAS